MNYFIDVTTIEELKKTFKKLAMKNHPDMGGSTEVMQEINRQYEEMLRRLANNKNLNETSDNFYDWTQDKFAEVIQKIIHFTGMTIEVIGEWIWCTNSFQYKEQLKELGFWFAKSKKAWVFSGENKKLCRGHYSLNQLRRKFATEKHKDNRTSKDKIKKIGKRKNGACFLGGFVMEQIKDLRQENEEIKTVEKVCAIHGKYISSVFGIGSQLIYSMCPMCEQTSKKDFLESAYKKQEHIKALNNMNVDTEYFDMTLDDYNAQNETQQNAKEATGKLICNELQKLILLGSNGLGKTMLGSIAVQAIGGAIYSAYEISLIVNGAENKYAELKKLSALPLLVIDEYEKVKDSDARKDLFSYLINKRHSNKMRTMILSEYHLFRNCKKHGCERCFDRLMTNDLISRLKQNGAIIEIIGNDYRTEI